MKNSTKIVIAVAVAVGVAGYVVPGLLLKQLAVRALRQSTGLEIAYRSLASDFWHRTMDIEGLVFRNPPDFPPGDAIEVRRLHAMYHWRDLGSDNLRLQELDVDIPHLLLIRREDGSTNIERLQAATEPVVPRQKQKGAAKPAAAEPTFGSSFDQLAAEVGAAPAKPAPKPAPAAAATPPAKRAASAPAVAAKELYIGHLHLRIGSVTIQDYGRKKKDGKPHTQELKVDVEQSFDNVTDLDPVAQELAAKILVQEGLRAVTEELQDDKAMEKLSRGFDKLADELGKLLK